MIFIHVPGLWTVVLVGIKILLGLSFTPDKPALKQHLFYIQCVDRIFPLYIKWEHFPRYWPFVRGIHRSPVNSSHKGQWRGALMFPLICAWINDWANNLEAGVLRRHQAHYDVIIMRTEIKKQTHVHFTHVVSTHLRTNINGWSKIMDNWLHSIFYLHVIIYACPTCNACLVNICS